MITDRPPPNPYPERITRTRRGLLPTEKAPLCNCCGTPMLNVTEARIGVHISCVQAENQKVSKQIPSARYGTKRSST